MDARIIRQLAFLLFVIACMVSVLVTGRFTVREILDGAISFAFVPIVEVVGFAPLGDPMEIRLPDYRLSLRRTEAARVAVSPLP